MKARLAQLALAAYIAAVQADASIPPACAADLIAVAEALEADAEK